MFAPEPFRWTAEALMAMQEVRRTALHDVTQWVARSGCADLDPG